MKICKIKIENFKAFKNVEISFDPNFNIIIGENNIGKSTIFEAIQLWKLGFDHIVQSRGNSFYATKTARYIPFEKLYFLRITSINDLSNNIVGDSVITLTICEDDTTYSLKISFVKPTSLDFYLRVKYEGKDFENFSKRVKELGLNLNTAIFIYQTKPVFNIIKKEPFFNNAQLMKKISLGKSNEVIRNKILKGDSDRKFVRLQERVSTVFEKRIIIRFKNKNLQDEEFVRMTLQVDSSKEIDISLVGSGLLQVLDIFSTIEFINRQDRGMNLLLIDEPDSHIHSNLQSLLIDELRKDLSNQHFIITHNDRLINKANEGELFYLNKLTLDSGIISPTSTKDYIYIAEELASKLHSLSEIERNKYIVLTEGKSDKRILEIAWSKLNPNSESPFIFISSGLHIDEETRTGNADSVKKTIEYISNLYSEIKCIGLFDNDREGFSQYNGLNKGIFKDVSTSDIGWKKHQTKNIFGVLLPCPKFRIDFVNNGSPTQRYLVIEHYFPDKILEDNNIKGDPIVKGTSVFEINGNKNRFSKIIETIDKSYFKEFELIFNSLNQMIEHDR